MSPVPNITTASSTLRTDWISVTEVVSGILYRLAASSSSWNSRARRHACVDIRLPSSTETATAQRKEKYHG